MIPFKHFVTNQLKRRSNSLLSSLLRQLNPVVTFAQSIRENHKNDSSLGSLFTPIPVKSNTSTENIGAELTSALNKAKVATVLNSFAQKPVVSDLAKQYGLDESLLSKALKDFRQYCITSETLPAELHVILNDVIHGAGNVVDLFPYFLRYMKDMYPHLECLDELKKISDLRHPPSWYPIARAKERRIIFHAGPTNSGKTYCALKRFMEAKSGVYCGPLKLLAVEVFNKCNAMGTPCDLITGEERKYIHGEMCPANHVACSVEMVNVENIYEVAILDEIQLLRDRGRGWAWTRAFLGIPADEIHLCGEPAAIPIIESLCATMGETVTVQRYERLTDLVVEKEPLGSLNNVQAGDCIVCFNKNDIFTVSRSIVKSGKEVAVIYGGLPPGTKLAEAARFNDVNNPCKILVATNAIGMGLNLHIRRIVFYSLTQLSQNEKGEMERDTISVSVALQIAGRAGRYGTQWSQGYVTTFRFADLGTLKNLLQQAPEQIQQVGLHPTAPQLELYAYYLPDAPLSSLIDIFISLCQVDDSLYFICNLDDFKFAADMIQHIPLPLRTRYIFCCAPIDRKIPLLCNMFLKFARRYSNGDKITVDWLSKEIARTYQPPRTISDLVHLEAVFDTFDTYLWLSYRFSDVFPDTDAVRELQINLDKIIEGGIQRLKKVSHRSAAVVANKQIPKMKEDRSNSKFNQFNYAENTDVELNEGSKPAGIADSLLSSGRLTPEMLNKLHKEWSNTNMMIQYRAGAVTAKLTPLRRPPGD